MPQLWCEQKGAIITLGPLLSAGGEGGVYEILEDPTIVAKIFWQPAEREHKLRIMVAAPPEDPMKDKGHRSLAWPIDLLYSTDGRRLFQGYLMPRIREQYSIFEFYHPKTRLRKHPLFNWRRLLRTARNLASAIEAVHDCRYVIGDLNASNILVADTALVTLIDTDSFQISDPKSGMIFLCPVGTPEFTPPELQDVKSFRDEIRTFEHDLFGLAVLIFLLLMEGTHPFAGSEDPPEIHRRIAKGYFPYAPDPAVRRLDGNRKLSPPRFAPPFEILPPNLQELFIQCFVEGHEEPKKRPNARDWRRALREAEENDLVACKANPQQHFYSKHLDTCPWCERARLIGLDPFPPREAVRLGQTFRQPSPSAHATRQQTVSGGTQAAPASSRSAYPRSVIEIAIEGISGAIRGAISGAKAGAKAGFAGGQILAMLLGAIGTLSIILGVNLDAGIIGLIFAILGGFIVSVVACMIGGTILGMLLGAIRSALGRATVDGFLNKLAPPATVVGLWGAMTGTIGGLTIASGNLLIEVLLAIAGAIGGVMLHTCSHCGHINMPDVTSCAQCGESLSLF